MVGQCMQLMRSAYYLIAVDQKVTNRRLPGCIGKLRSNFQETEFDLFGIGESFEKKLPLEQTRDQHAAIIYNLGTKETGGQNRIDVVLPKIVNEKKSNSWKPTTVIINIKLLERRTLNRTV